MTDTSRDDAASNEKKKGDNSDDNQNTADHSLSNTDNAADREVYPRPVSPTFDGTSSAPMSLWCRRFSIGSSY